MSKKRKYFHFEMPENPDELNSPLGIIVPQARANGQHLDKVKGELEKESDRGCVLVAGAYIDSELASLLLAFFVKQNTKANAELFEFNGPVGTFSSRIKLAFAVGLISEEVRHDVEIIRGLRNDSAHLYEEMTFNRSSINDRVKLLKLTAGEKFETSKKRFIANVARIGTSLHLSAELTHHQSIPRYIPIENTSNVEDYELNIAAHRILASTAPELSFDQAKEMAHNIKEGAPSESVSLEHGIDNLQKE